MTNKIELGNATILIGDVLEQIKNIPDESIHCCITSPPYWGLRDYKAGSQMIGLEPTFQDWLDKMVEVCRELKRVLRKDGTFWLNCGDKYNSLNDHSGKADKTGSNYYQTILDNKANIGGTTNEFKPKDLLLMPARLAIALQADGWWVRSEIVWSKKNPMPESVKSRPSQSHEKIFMLTKSKHYFFDAEAVKEPGTEEPDTFRNIRNIWTMPTQAYPGSHFATFPEELPRKCILAGTSEKGCCPKCGAQYERIVERNGIRDWQNDEIVPKGIPGESIGPGTNKRGQANRPVVPKGKTYDAEMQGSGTSIKGHSGNFKCDGSPISPETKTIGWKPTCDCHGFDPVPCTVLDIFAGSGTTLKVALELNRRAIGIELNPDYIKQIKSRIMKEATQEKFVI